ncbi:MAG: DUF1932 domain-containing protein [Acidimicrobiia bacterium]
MPATIGILHPGAMGAAVGATLVADGAEVVWASTGRSDATRARADGAGLVDAVSIAGVTARADVVLSVCPPEAAGDVAKAVAATGFAGTYVDANAVSPATAHEVAMTVARAGATFVDGGIIGPPPHPSGTTRLYLSGPGSRSVAELFSATALDARVVDDRIGSASALKMTYAAYTKGLAALLLALRETAGVHGVEPQLVAEWQISQPGLLAAVDAAAANATPKAWRWVAEMKEIAATFAAAGQPAGFHLAAADVYRALAASTEAR